MSLFKQYILLFTASSLVTSVAAIQQESLVMTGLVAYPSRNGPLESDFNVIELTACSEVADLTYYTIAEYSSKSTSPYQSVAFQGQRPASIPQGSTIYASQLLKSDFVSFFGFSPDFYYQSTFGFIGTNNLALVYQGTTTVDVYGVVGMDHSDTKADFGNGWAVRQSDKAASTSFDVKEWQVAPGAYSNVPTFNLQSPSPVTLGNYTCGPSVAAVAPSGSPKPVQAERTGGRDDSRDYHRPPVAPIPPASTDAPITPSPTPVPVPPTYKPNNPPRPKPTKNRRPRGPPPVTTMPTPCGEYGRQLSLLRDKKRRQASHFSRRHLIC